MGFADRYIQALGASNLKDDEHHHQTDTLAASALADKCARDIGALLHRVKYSGTMIAKITKAAAECERLEKLLVEAQRAKASQDSKVASITSALESCVSGHAGVGSEIHEFRSLRRAWREIVFQKGRERKWIKDRDWPTMGSIFPAMVDRIAAHSLARYLDARAELPPMNNYEKTIAEGLVSELMALESTHAGIGKSKLRTV